MRGNRVRIAIDDFGTGIRRCLLLQAVPGRSVRDRPVLHCGMGKSPRGTRSSRTDPTGKDELETLAGLAGQLAQLRGEECDVGQGYFFARPVEPEEIERFFTPANSPTFV